MVEYDEGILGIAGVLLTAPCAIRCTYLISHQSMSHEADGRIYGGDQECRSDVPHAEFAHHDLHETRAHAKKRSIDRHITKRSCVTDGVDGKRETGVEKVSGDIADNEGGSVGQQIVQSGECV